MTEAVKEETISTPEDMAYELMLNLMGQGYTGREAQELSHKRHLGEYKSQEDNHNEYPIRKVLRLDSLPEGFIDWNDGEKKEALYFLGFDIYEFSYEHRLEWCRLPDSNIKTEFMEIVVGAERRDEEWTLKVVDGRSVASDEARYFYMQEELRDIRGCRGKASRKTV